MAYTALIIGLVLFVFALYKNNQTLIFALIMQGLVLDIISIQFGANISLLKLIGIYYLLVFVLKFKHFIKFKLIQLFAACFGLLFLSFIFYNFISPWTDPDFLFKRNLINSSKQIFTFLSEFGCIFFLGNYFLDIKKKNIIKFVLPIILLAIAGIYLEKFLQIDFFHILTGGPKMLIASRMRGFNFEPRAASYYMAIIITCSLFIKLSLFTRILVITLASGGLILANSMTGIVILTFCIALLYLLSIFLKTNYLKKLNIFVLITISTIFVLYKADLIKENIKHLKKRSYIVNSKKIVNKLEGADSVVASFYIKNPQYLVFGLGVGQAPAATSKYMTAKVRRKFPNGLTYLPFMGIILLIANGGLFLLGIYTTIVIYGLKQITKLKINKENRDSLIVLTCIFISTYLLQARYFHILAFSLMLYAELKNSKHTSEPSLSSSP